MPHYKLALLGFGNVGRALAELLLRKQEEIQKDYNLTFSVVAIGTGRRGFAVQPDGFDLPAVMDALGNGKTLAEFSAFPVEDAFDLIRKSGADVLFENTPVDYASGQPAIDHIKLALEQGMHVSTANKGPVVHAWHELKALAAQKGRQFFHESTVMDGAPIFSLFRGALPGAQLQSFRAVLNSTTNLILTRMESGESFDEAVRYAQQIGIAETDPSGDIDGWDAAIKIAALATVLMDKPLKPGDVDRTASAPLPLRWCWPPKPRANATNWSVLPKKTATRCAAKSPRNWFRSLRPCMGWKARLRSSSSIPTYSVN
jgi:homoserine dehydrogenase